MQYLKICKNQRNRVVRSCRHIEIEFRLFKVNIKYAKILFELHFNLR